MVEKTLKALIVAGLMLVSSVPVSMLFAEPGGPVPTTILDDFDLVARRTSTPPTIDGTVDPIWDGAKVLKAFVSGDSGQFDVYMKALFDDDYVYLLAYWNEPNLPDAPVADVDREQWELTSNATPGTWEHKDLGEDRLSFFFEDPDNPVPDFDINGCDAICHNLDEMYTVNPGEMLDAWVWSAATTNPTGYADDGVLLNNNTVAFDAKRMHVTTSDLDWDEGTDGWWVNNDTSSATLRPSFVWKPGATPANLSFMYLTDAEEVDWDTFDIATIPTGTKVPGHVLMTPSGDRADVQAKGIHNGTGWNVEFKRLRDTGSDDDVAFDRTNVKYRFGPAITNNRTGDKHSKGVHQYHLWLAEPEDPDLVVASMSPSGSRFTVNSTILLGVNLENIGWVDAAATKISWQWDVPGAPDPVTEDVPAIRWGQWKYIEFNVSTDDLEPGNNTLVLMVDALDAVAEINESNNMANRTILLDEEDLPNLKITSVEMDPLEIAVDGYSQISVLVENDGMLDVTSTGLILYLEDPGSPITTETIGPVPKGGSYPYMLTWGPVDLPEGPYILNVTVDPDDEIKEGDEEDNTFSLPFNVTAPTLPDLVVSEVTPINTTVTQGEETRTQVKVTNSGGSVSTGSFQIALFLDQAFTAGTAGLMATANVNEEIAIGGDVTVVLIWTVPSEIDVGSDHFLRAQVDWLGEIDELDESNNNATFDGLVVQRQKLPDLTITQISPVDPTVKLESRVTFTAVVKNTGRLASSNTTLQIKDITNNNTLEVLSVPGLEVNGTVNINFTWLVSGVPLGGMTLRFMADHNDLILEDNEFNNALNVQLTVEPPDLPDLTFVEEDPMVFLPAEPRVGEAVTISVKVTNIGTNGSIATTMELWLGNNVISTANVPALGVGETRSIDVPWGAQEIQSASTFKITARLDPSNNVKELDKTNNEVSANITFVKPKAAVLDNLAMTVEPTEVEDGGEVTVTVSIENTGNDAAFIGMVLKDGVTEVDSKQGITVPAGGSKEETFNIKLEGSGDHVMAVTIYEGADVAKDPAGNDLVKQATVTVLEKEEDGSNTMLYVGIAVVIIVVALVAVVFFLRRK